MLRYAVVIAISLIVFVIPNVVGAGVWFLSGGLPAVLRSLAAILGWVASFALSSMLFWRLVLVTFGIRSK